MKYISTRNNSKEYSFEQVFIKGLADDGGWISADQMVSDMPSSAGTPLLQSILARRKGDIRTIKSAALGCARPPAEIAEIAEITEITKNGR